jgi:hypothetical protein
LVLIQQCLNSSSLNVTNIEVVLLYFVKDNKMILLPVQNTGEVGFLLQLLQRNFDPLRTEAYRLCRIAYSQHRDALTGDERTFPKRL